MNAILNRLRAGLKGPGLLQALATGLVGLVAMIFILNYPAELPLWRFYGVMAALGLLLAVNFVMSPVSSTQAHPLSRLDWPLLILSAALVMAVVWMSSQTAVVYLLSIVCGQVRPKLEPTVAQMLVRTEIALQGGARVVGWQESSAWALEEDKPEVLERAATLARRYHAYVQLSLEVITRTQRLPVLRNESILIDPSGDELWTYDKAHPVPYDEAFATIAGRGRLPVVETPYGRLSTAICYDTYFPALIRQAGRGDADILFAPSNDSQPLAESALAIACYRAVENGCAILRPTGNGVSAVIDDRGRVLARRDTFTDHAGVMLASVPTRGVRTICSRVGDAFAYLGAAGLAVLVAWAKERKRRSRRLPRRLPKGPAGAYLETWCDHDRGVHP